MIGIWIIFAGVLTSVLGYLALIYLNRGPKPLYDFSPLINLAAIVVLGAISGVIAIVGIVLALLGV